MALRNLTRCLFQVATHRRFYSSIPQQIFNRKPMWNNQRFPPLRSFSSAQSTENPYKDLNEFLQKEISLEKGAQKHPSNLPTIEGFEVCSLVLFSTQLFLTE